MIDNPIEILLVEDNPGDARLTVETLLQNRKVKAVHHVETGAMALKYLRRMGEYRDAVRPSAVILDLNLPGMHGEEVLAEIKQDKSLRRIPVVILTSSRSLVEIDACYDLHANGYVVKPVDFDGFMEALRSIEQFWCEAAELPRGDGYERGVPEDPLGGR